MTLTTVKDHLKAVLRYGLQAPDAVTRRTERMADDLSDELRAIYLDWLDEAEAEIDEAESNADRDAASAALLLLLLARVRRRVDLRLVELAEEVDAAGPVLDAMRGQMEETMTVFENNTLPAIEGAMNEALVNQEIARQMEDEVAPLSDSLSGRAAHVALVGGALWSAHQAGKIAGAQTAGLFARWEGPDDDATCVPCSQQMGIGWRPVGQVPIPGPAVCLGLTNCRHNVIFQDPVTGATSSRIGDLI